MPPRDVLDDLNGFRRVVMIGESPHSRHEFHSTHAAVSRWLIESKGFNAIAGGHAAHAGNRTLYP
jgi:erythromycin esterase-like protein